MMHTQSHEAQYIKENQNIVWMVYHRSFKNLRQICYENKEDLFQEGIGVLIQHYRKSKNEEELKRIPLNDIKNSMSRYVLRDQPLTYPVRTSGFSEYMDDVKKKIDCSLDESEQIGISLSSTRNFEEDICTKVDLELFVQTLKPKERLVLNGLVSGYRQSEIAKMIKCTVRSVQHAVSDIRKKFLSYYSDTAQTA